MSKISCFGRFVNCAVLGKLNCTKVKAAGVVAVLALLPSEVGETGVTRNNLPTQGPRYIDRSLSLSPPANRIVAAAYVI